MLKVYTEDILTNKFVGEVESDLILHSLTDIIMVYAAAVYDLLESRIVD